MIKKIVVVMVCLMGVVYIFMVVEVLEIEVCKCGDWIKVEICGFVGVKNMLIVEEIVQVDVVIIVVDIELDLLGFVGKRFYCISIGVVLKKSVQEMDNVFNSVEVYQGSVGCFFLVGKIELFGVYKYLMIGVFYMFFLVVVGGLCIVFLVFRFLMSWVCWWLCYFKLVVRWFLC